MRTYRRAARHLSRWLWVYILAAALLFAGLVLLTLTEFTHTLTWQQIGDFIGFTPAGQTAAPQNAVSGPPAAGTARVSVLDVGQGDSILIEADGEAVLIDAGDWYAGGTVVSELRARGIEKLACVIATHPHRDHIGGLREVLQQCKAERVIFTNHSAELTPTTPTYTELLQWLLDNDVPVVTAATGETIPVGKGTLTLLTAGGYSELNDCSIVSRFDYGGTAFLFAGDAGFPVENDLLADGAALDCDVLKAGHHGSASSSSAAFLAAVSPQYIAVSCGADNGYGNPADAFLRRAQGCGAQLLRTDTMGTILFTSDGTKVTAEVTKNSAQEAA